VRLHLAPFIFLLLASTASAQDFVSARALGVGEAYRALASGNDAIYFNPAGLTLLKRYSIEGQYFMNLVEETHQGDISVVDSKTNPLAVGLAYTFQGSELTKRATLEHVATLGVAYPIFDKIFSVGAGFKYKNVSDAIAGNYLNALTADLGALSQIPGGLSFAAVGYNLIPIRSVESAHVPVSAGFAAAWDLGPASSIFFGGTPVLGGVQTVAGVPDQPGLGSIRGPLSGLTLSFDWLVDFESIYGAQSKYSGGIEYLLFDMVPVRAGYIYDEVNNVEPQQKISGGIGFIVPYFGFDVTYQQSITQLDARVLAIALKGFLPM
jgi:hypothetical protein